MADDDELQGLYQSALGISPQVGQLVQKYQDELSDLHGLNSKFVQARTRFDQIVVSDPNGHPGVGTPGVPYQAHQPNSSLQMQSPKRSYSQDSTYLSSQPTGYQHAPSQLGQQPPVSAHPTGYVVPQPAQGQQQQQRSPAASTTQPVFQHGEVSEPVQSSQAYLQPPPGLDPSSPEYARWYYSVFPQAAPQPAQ